MSHFCPGVPQAARRAANTAARLSVRASRPRRSCLTTEPRAGGHGCRHPWSMRQQLRRHMRQADGDATLTRRPPSSQIPCLPFRPFRTEDARHVGPCGESAARAGSPTAGQQQKDLLMQPPGTPQAPGLGLRMGLPQCGRGPLDLRRLLSRGAWWGAGDDLRHRRHRALTNAPAAHPDDRD
jgi:hypothetical protein